MRASEINEVTAMGGSLSSSEVRTSSGVVLSSSWLGGLVTRVRLGEGPWLAVMRQPCRDLLARTDGRVELLFGDGPLDEEWVAVAAAQARGWLVEEPTERTTTQWGGER